MKQNLFLLYIATFVNILGFGMVFPLLPFYAEHFGAGPGTLGLLSASFAVAQFFASPFIGRLSDRFGRKPIIVLSLLGTALAFLGTGFASSLPLLFLARTFHGIVSAGIFPVCSAYVGDITQKEERVKYMGRLGATFALGFLTGPAVSGLLAPLGIAVPFFAAAILSFLNFVFVLLFLKESLTLRSSIIVFKEGLVNITAMFKALHGETGALFFILFGWAFAISNFEVGLPLFTQDAFSFGSREIGFLFTMNGTAAALIQWFLLPALGKRFSEYAIIPVAVVIMAVGQFLIPYASSVIPYLVLFLLTSTLGGASLRPTINSALSKSTLEGQGTMFGLAFSFESLGRAVGALLAGFFIGGFGISSQFAATSVILLLGLGMFLWTRRRGLKQ